jgi:hypothetical protein
MDIKFLYLLQQKHLSHYYSYVQNKLRRADVANVSSPMVVRHDGERVHMTSYSSN